METPKIKIFYYNDFPDNLVNEFVDSTKGEGYQLVLEKGRRRYLNFIEDFLATIVIFLATSYVAGLLNKAGSDTYDKLIASIPKLKKSVSELIKKMQDLKSFTIRSGQEPIQTKCNLSIILEIHKKLTFEFMFLGKTEPKVLQDSVDLLFQTLDKDEFIKEIEELISELNDTSRKRVVRFMFSGTENRWEIYDPLKEKFKHLAKMSDKKGD